MVLAEGFIRSGKVRDLFRLPDRRLVLVASDRLSAFDVVLPTTIPDKGKVLTGLSRYWFGETRDAMPNHLLDTDVAVIEDAFERDVPVTGQRDVARGLGLDLGGRVMICRPAYVLPFEAVVRGYLAGSAWKDYQAHGAVAGVKLPPGLHEADALPEPLFTPATKADDGGHDQNISFDEMVRRLVRYHGRIDGEIIAETIRDKALWLYRFARAVLDSHGIVLADTKFEFGVASGDDAGRPVGPEREQIVKAPPRGHLPEIFESTLAIHRIILIDEILTPDSSRFWDASTYTPGRPQASFDKQFVRDWLETQPWDKSAPGPALPDDVVAGTRARYVEAFERITGASFERYLQEDVIAP